MSLDTVSAFFDSVKVMHGGISYTHPRSLNWKFMKGKSIDWKGERERRDGGRCVENMKMYAKWRFGKRNTGKMKLELAMNCQEGNENIFIYSAALDKHLDSVYDNILILSICFFVNKVYFADSIWQRLDFSYATQISLSQPRWHGVLVWQIFSHSITLSCLGSHWSSLTLRCLHSRCSISHRFL